MRLAALILIEWTRMCRLGASGQPATLLVGESSRSRIFANLAFILIADVRQRAVVMLAPRRTESPVLIIVRCRTGPLITFTRLGELPGRAVRGLSTLCLPANHEAGRPGAQRAARILSQRRARPRLRFATMRRGIVVVARRTLVFTTLRPTIAGPEARAVFGLAVVILLANRSTRTVIDAVCPLRLAVGSGLSGAGNR